MVSRATGNRHTAPGNQKNEAGNRKPGTVNMCTGCPGLCCKLVVELSSYDIMRIMLRENKSTDDFLLVVDAADDDAYKFQVLGKYAKFVMQMRENNSCIFLDETARLKCVIEKSKPAICIAYPYSFRDGHLVMRDDKRCPTENLRRARYAQHMHSIMESNMWEWDRYAEIVEDWNASAKGSETPGEFMNFATKEMELETSPLGSVYRKFLRLFRKREH
ncbi:MAG: YkgJ family cysteine cluster protein [Candidatus Micrarchaeota archaeon]